MINLIDLEKRFNLSLHEKIIGNFFESKIGKKASLFIFFGPIVFIPQTIEAWSGDGRISMLVLWIFFGLANPLAYSLVPKGKSTPLRWLYIIYTIIMSTTLLGEIIGFMK